MNRVLFAALCVAALPGCSEPDVRAVAVGVSWLEWPAEVRAGDRFNARLSGYLPACGADFVPAYQSDLSAVSFEPYALVPEPPPCVNLALASIVPSLFDETVAVSSLGAPSTRTFEMRAATHISTGEIVVRTFGDIVVRPDSVQTHRVNAGGQVLAARDQAGCLRIYPVARYFSTGYPVENPPDTTSTWAAFVRGYLAEATEPVCGETRIFHLVTRN